MAMLNFNVVLQARGGARACRQLSDLTVVVERHEMLVAASMFGLADHADRYSRRVGVETVRSVHAALADATELIRFGRGELLEPTVVCASAPLRPSYVEGLLRHVELVDPGFADALASSRSSVEASLELRTPPGDWTSPPPKELFLP